MDVLSTYAEAGTGERARIMAALRTLVQGVHGGMGEGGARRARPAQTEETTSPSASWTT